MTAKIIAKEIMKKRISVNPDGSSNVSIMRAAIEAANINVTKVFYGYLSFQINDLLASYSVS